MSFKKFVLSIILVFIVSYGMTQETEKEDFEWLVVLNYSPDDSNCDTPLSYSNHGDFHEGLARVNAYNKGGYINTEGKLVIKFQSGILHDFHEGLAPILREQVFWGFINKHGETVIKPQFLPANDCVISDFSEGLTPIAYSSYGGAYINKQGKQVIKFDHNMLLKSFSEGLACVLDFDKWGYINKQGRYVIKPSYTEANDFHDGLARVAIDDDVFYIDKTGKVIFGLPLGYSNYGGNFSNGLLLVEKDNQYGYLNKKGEVVISLQFHEAFDFHDGLAAVSDGNTLFYIDINGKTVFEIPAGYLISDLNIFSEGLVIIIKDGKYGYMDKKGNVIIEPQFDEVHPFSEGFALVKKGDKRGYIKHPLNLK